MNTPPVPSIGKIIFRRSTVRGTPHIMNPCPEGILKGKIHRTRNARGTSSTEHQNLTCSFKLDHNFLQFTTL